MLVHMTTGLAVAGILPLAWFVTLNTLRGHHAGALISWVTLVIVAAHMLLLPPTVERGAYFDHVPMILRFLHACCALLLALHFVAALAEALPEPTTRQRIILLNRLWTSSAMSAAIILLRHDRVSVWSALRFSLCNLAASMLVANELCVALQDDRRTAGVYQWIASLFLIAAACTPARRAWLRELLLTTPLRSLTSIELESWVRSWAATQSASAELGDQHSGGAGDHDEWCTMSEASTVPRDDDFYARPLNTAEAVSWHRRHGPQSAE